MAYDKSDPAARGTGADWPLGIAGGLIALGLVVSAVVSLAQESVEYDLSKVSPDVYTTIYEDDSVWVWEAFYTPGKQGKPHSHLKPYTVYIIEGTTFRITEEDGSVRDIDLEARKFFNAEARRNHFGWNTDNENQARFVVVQPK